MKDCSDKIGGVPRLGRVMSACALMLTVWATGALSDEPAPKDLRLFYQKNCARCHGVDGSALDSKGRKMSGQDFTDVRWRKDTRDAEMVKVILKGKFFGWAMPAFKDILTKGEAQRMVTDVVRQAAKGKPIESKASSTGR